MGLLDGKTDPFRRSDGGNGRSDAEIKGEKAPK
jgi:hypothetical protein